MKPLKSMLFKYTQVLEKRDNKFLVYSPLTDTAIVLDRKFCEESTCKESTCTKKLKQFDGLGIFKTDDDIKTYEKWYQDSAFGNKYLSINIHTTYKCNMKCGYCYQSSLNNQRQTLDKETADKIFNSIKQKAKDGCTYLDICYIGGEPLINIEIMEYLARKFNHLNIKHDTIVVTNGTFLTSENVKRLKKVGIEKYQVTLDGTREIHDKLRPYINGTGTFDKIIDNIKAVHNNAKIYLNVNISEDNFKNIFQLCDFIKDQNFNVDLMFSMVFEGKKKCKCKILKTDKENDRWYKIHRYAMEMGFNFAPFYRNSLGPCSYFKGNHLNIGPNGDLYNCPSAVGDKSFYLCDIGKLNCTEYRLAKNKFQNERISTKECKECNFLPLCEGGCAYERKVKKLEKICHKNDIQNNDLLLAKDTILKEMEL